MSDRLTKDYIDSGQSIKNVLGAHVNTFMSAAVDLGYSPSTMRTQLQVLKKLIRWVQENDILISNIDESITDRFLSESGRKGAHLLRHSLATGMLREGASMTEIGELLRHRSPNISEIYAKVDIERLRSIARIWPEKKGAM